jgi:hypothetical protein
MLGRTKVGFAPYRPYPFFRRLAPWPFRLGCRSADCTLTLDTWKEYRGSSLFQMVRRYCEEIDLLRLGSERGGGGMITLRIAEALGRNTAEGLTLRIYSITSE